MTTAEHIRALGTPNPGMTIAGVVWPRYKAVALVVGLIVAGLVGLVTMAAGPAVLAGAALGTAIWLVYGSAAHFRN